MKKPKDKRENWNEWLKESRIILEKMSQAKKSLFLKNSVNLLTKLVNKHPLLEIILRIKGLDEKIPISYESVSEKT